MVDWHLRAHSELAPAAGPLVIVVMDGVGVGPNNAGNAVISAHTPTLDGLRQSALYAELKAHGTAVGLPSDKDMGNSEVGHNAVGAGRVFDQGAKLVDMALQSGSLFNGKVWKQSMSCNTLHFIGLLSDGNVHSHEKHLHALLQQARREGVERARVHILLDGRDVPESSALTYVDRLEAVLAELGDYKIASGGGRMLVTMDRYQADWEIVKRGWEAHVHGNARRFGSTREAIETFRTEEPGIIDQYLPAFSVESGATMADGDAVIFFNYRGDRSIEISRAFEESDFHAFDRGRVPDVQYAGIMQYDGDLRLPKRYLVRPPAIDLTFGEYLVNNRVPQWACSETQKFGHVTYFWNGNRSGMFDSNYEKYVEIQSDNLPFDQAPQMKAKEITDAAIQALQSGRWKLLRLNYANGDMVGHTGNLNASITAMEVLDRELGRLARAVQKMGGILMVTADHGNCDEMYLQDKCGDFKTNQDGSLQARTSHTLNPVPFYIQGAPQGVRLNASGRLSNVAATALNLLGYEAPDDYDPSLLS
ncbi:MAG TPA: 2,3-bisphosphoglycerate-independent phosphoglycerate mutase [Myxococcales bacterium]|nr:2,3-bisphosphoglycerate-independent phosphoglycerate mutase [Myxococcales bacterium]HIN86399.1 2,3-bisphosphoglycerate-independent phosphoglycerate mutase [Myxococcales bacterium]